MSCSRRLRVFRIRGVSETRGISIEDISLYLNDHLAGSVIALELIDHMREKNPGTELAGFLEGLHREIKEDQQLLKDLLARFGGTESAIRKAGAWLAEKLGRAKLGLSRSEKRGTGLLEALEGLALGIAGKQLLWRSLRAAAETLPQLRVADFDALEKSAVAQQERVEERRLAAARDAFQPKE